MDNDDEFKVAGMCLLCPSDAGSWKRMTARHLRLHLAACHVDRPKNPKQILPNYRCTGNSILPIGKASCAPDIRFDTAAVNIFVDHLKEDHPDEDLPVSMQYKAALSDCMAEVCMLVFRDPSTDSRVRKTAYGLAVNKKPGIPKSANVIAVTKNSIVPQQPTTAAVADVDQESRMDITETVGQSQENAVSALASSTKSKISGTSNISGAVTAASTSKQPAAANEATKKSPYKAVFSSREYQDARRKFNKLVATWEPRILCTKCEKLWSTTVQGTLKHAMTHMEKRPLFECRHCNATFGSAVAGYAHVRKEHPNCPGSKVDWLVDKRIELEADIVRLWRECYDF